MTKTITVSSSPWSITVNPKSNIIHVANCHNGTTTVINGATNCVITNIQSGKFSNYVDVNPMMNIVCVSNVNGHTVTVINGITNKALSIKS